MTNQQTEYTISRNISYGPHERNILDVYKPNSATISKVLIFVHGGSWINGSKDQYTELGKTFVGQGVETIIINYRLAPKNNYSAMATDIAQAVNWTVKHSRAGRLSGKVPEIYLMGHSAGAHLVALVCSDDKYLNRFNLKDAVSGVIVDDAFGLDLSDYYAFIQNPYAQQFIPAFGRDQTHWKDATPLLHLKKGNPIRFLILNGSRTYEPIISGSKKFYNRLKEEGINVKGYSIAEKGHQEMITAVRNSSDSLFQKIIAFMN